MKKRKILVTGGKGMFATDFTQVLLTQGFEVFSLSHEQMNVTHPGQVKAVLDEIRPDMVVHTVGLPVDFCEAHPEEAHRVHVWGTGLIARHCQRQGVILVNLSTCGLFGDEKKFYSEYDPVVLKTVYARSKFLAEQEAVNHCERTFNIRPGWLFGGNPTHKKNFVYQRYLEAKQKPVLHSAGDKFGSPTWTKELAEKITELLETNEYGLYHVTSENGGSRYDYVKAIVEVFGLPTVVEKVDSSFYPRSSPVPNCEMLENRHLRFLGLKPLANWREGLTRYVKELHDE